MASKRCSNCGQSVLNSLSYTHNGKTFCYECFKKMQSDLLAAEDDQQVLYRYIKQLFSVTEVPQEVVASITREAAKGKKYRGLRLTLHYYYEILENQPNDITYVPFVIRDQYENARKYEEESRKIQEINQQVDLSNTPTRTVKLKATDLTNNIGRKKKKYDITDL